MPPISGYFDEPFAASGTRATIPDAVQGDGSVSYTQGWGVDYTLPNTNPSYKFMPQDKFNQLFFDITTALQNWQQNTIAPFITSTMNGGTPYTYPAYAMVLSGGIAYISNTAGNADTPPSSKWTQLNFSAANVFTGGTTTGSANAQVLASLSPATGFSLSNNGQTIVCTAGFTNTGNTTLAVTSPAISATTIKKDSGSGLVALTGGEIIAADTIYLTVNTAGSCLVLTAGLPLGALAYLNPGTGVSSSGGNLNVAPATSSVIGGIIPDGTVITVDGSGHATVPNATSGAKGVVQVDNSTIIASSGVISAVTQLPNAYAIQAQAHAGSGSALTANATVSAASLTFQYWNTSSILTPTGDSVTGTWKVSTSTASNSSVGVQRIA